MGLFLSGMAADPVFGSEKENHISYSVDKWSQYMIENVIGLSLLGVLYHISTLSFLGIFCLFVSSNLNFIIGIQCRYVNNNPEENANVDKGSNQETPW